MVQALDHRRPVMELSLKALRFIDGWLQRGVWVAQIIMVLCMLIAVLYAADRQPPFAILEVHPAEARPGEIVTVTAHVWRDRDRNCSATFSRYLFDSQHARFDLAADNKGSPYFASDAMIDRIEADSPGMLSVRFLVPTGMAVGPAVLQTELRYACNQMHRIWPIEVTTRMPFTVLP